MNLKAALWACLFCMSFYSTAQTNQHYQHAFTEFEAVLREERTLSFKEAVFLTETAFVNGTLNKAAFDQEINTLLAIVEHVKRTSQNLHTKNVSANFAIYKTLTTPTAFILDSATRIVQPSFQYDRNDHLGKQEWVNTFVTKLLISRKGNCHSLAYLYKILADELDVDAELALAPNHIYVKHKLGGTDGLGYNTELTNKSFPTDAQLMSSSYISLKAVQNGIYLKGLSKREGMALTLVDLAQGYVRKFDMSELSHLKFALKCVDLALSFYPNYINALLLKAKLLRTFQEVSGENLFVNQLNEVCAAIYKLGYQQMPEAAYLKWISGQQLLKDETINRKMLPYPAANKHALTLSKGEFNESIPLKRYVSIGRMLYDSQTEKVVKVLPVNTISPELMGRWLSEDPLTWKFSGESPYNFASNMPIIAIDPDGREIIIATTKKEYTGPVPEHLGHVAKTQSLISLKYNEIAGEWDLHLETTIVYSRAFNEPGANGKTLEQENPGLTLYADTHEGTHVKRTKFAVDASIKLTTVNLLREDGREETFFGRADQLMTQLETDFRARRKVLRSRLGATTRAAIFDKYKVQLEEAKGDLKLTNQIYKSATSELEEVLIKFDAQTEARLKFLVKEILTEVEANIQRHNEHDGEGGINARTAGKLPAGSNARKMQDGEKSVTYQGKELNNSDDH